jgi:hypothetical protein
MINNLTGLHNSIIRLFSGFAFIPGTILEAHVCEMPIDEDTSQKSATMLIET